MKIAILALFALVVAAAAAPVAPARIKAPGVDGVTGEYSTYTYICGRCTSHVSSEDEGGLACLGTDAGMGVKRGCYKQGI
jgi:hypothetical protein